MNQAHSIPKNFILDEFETNFSYSEESVNSVWNRLNQRETFTKGQLFPYKVEFDATSQEGKMCPGELNIHHGPFLSVHGAIGEVTDHYRSLNYFYGSYVFSFRLVRPIQLEFFRDNNIIKVKFKVHVRPWFRPVWHLINFVLWTFFRITL